VPHVVGSGRVVSAGEQYPGAVKEGWRPVMIRSSPTYPRNRPVLPDGLITRTMERGGDSGSDLGNNRRTILQTVCKRALARDRRATFRR
jgi:hypothetical protein